MSRGAEAILAALDDLPPTEREQVVSELLRRVALSEHAPVSDEEFQALDRGENSRR